MSSLSPLRTLHEDSQYAGILEKKLAKFHHDIDAGRYLILIYARRGKGAAIRAMMRARHPEADLVAMDRNYFNPFSAVRKRARVARRQEARAQQLLQKN